VSASVYLRATPFLDVGHPEVVRFATETAAGAESPVEQVQALFYAVRDGVRYDPYRLDFRPEAHRASAVLARGYGFCVNKAVLLAASARVLGIPSRLGFADVLNHLVTERLRREMGTDLFVFHAFAELEVEGTWVKAAPAFNRTLCERFDVEPLAFDGRHDAMLQQADRQGNRYIEYVRDRGRFEDLPLDLIVRAFREHYPHAMANGQWELGGTFEDDAAREGGTG
jgi:transglutaminase-like putative cysteine protease